MNKKSVFFSSNLNYDTIDDEKIVDFVKSGDKCALEYLINKYRNLVNLKVNRYFIIGADSLLYIQDWYHPEYICSHCHLLCANRDNNSASVLIDHKHFLADKYGAVIDFIDVPKLPYSSTDIRKKVAMGLSVKEDVGEEVEEYIKSRKLYV